MSKIASKICRVALCSRTDIKSDELCNPHWQRQRRILRGIKSASMEQPVRGTLEYLAMFGKQVCLSRSCNAPVKANGLCGGHYLRSLKGHETDSPLRRSARYASSDECRISNCVEQPLCQGLCTRHYAKLKTYGESGITALQEWIINGCAVCANQSDLPHIDHDHSCCPVNKNGRKRKTCGSCVRGALCYRCNIALGLLDDSLAKLTGMITYLTRGRIVEQRREA